MQLAVQDYVRYVYASTQQNAALVRLYIRKANFVFPPNVQIRLSHVLISLRLRPHTPARMTGIHMHPVSSSRIEQKLVGRKSRIIQIDEKGLNSDL